MGSRISNFFRPAQRYDVLNLSESLVKLLVMAKLNMAYICQVKKPSKTAVVLIAGVTISGTPCPLHITVPFGAEAPSGHVPRPEQSHLPSWCLPSTTFLRPVLRNPIGHWQQTTTPETNEASSVRTQWHSFKRFHALYDDKLPKYKKKVFKLYLFNPLTLTIRKYKHLISAQNC